MSESLRELLARVRERLGGTSLDRESRELLAALVRDIERALAAGTVAAAATGPVGNLLESLAVRFEAGHPALAELLRQLIDVLGKGGV